MSSDHIPGLGPKHEAPKLNPKADFAAAKLTPQDGFVLSRIDGRTSLGEICLISGLGEAATVAALQKLKAALIIVTSAPMSELPPELAPASAAKAATYAGAARDEAAGRRGGPARAAGGEHPAAPPSRPRSGGWPATAPVTESARPVPPLPEDELDPALLADGKDLSAETKRRVLAFHRRMPELDLFDRLEVDPHADKQVIRRAYFRLSKEFHPDRYYGKELGAYREMLGDIFKAISAAFATLSDDAQRQAYLLQLCDRAATQPAAAPSGTAGPTPRKPR